MMRLKRAVFLLTLAGLTSIVASASEAPMFALKQVGEGVWAAVSPPGSKAGANAGFVVGSDSVAVIDTFEDPEAARQLLAEIRKITKLPVRYVVNTHYHIDHVAGNGVFAGAGALILAQRNVRAWIHTENLKFFGPNPKPEQKAMVDSLVAPQIVYDDGVDIYLGSRRLEVRYFPGHTGSDSVVFVPDAHVVFTGDLFWKDSLPNLIDASTRPWISTLDNLLARQGSPTFVPGHGEIGKVSDVRNFRDYLAYLREVVGQAVAAGKSGDALVNAVLPELRQKYGSWEFFRYFSRSNILQTEAELRGEKKIPAPAAN